MENKFGMAQCKKPECMCADLLYQCEKGGCIAWSRVCDGTHDCQDQTDEFCKTLIIPNVLILEKLVNCEGTELTIPETYADDLYPDCLEENTMNEKLYHRLLRGEMQPKSCSDPCSGGGCLAVDIALTSKSSI